MVRDDSLVVADIVHTAAVRLVFELEPIAPAGRLVWDAIGTTAAMSLGYTFFFLFMNVTATRHLRAQTEMAVAHGRQSPLTDEFADPDLSVG